MEGKLKEEIEKKGLTKSITVTGRVPKIYPYYKLADVFVSSSIREGLPITILEAMASNLPIVGPAIPGVIEVIEEGDNGYLVPPQSPQKLAQSMVQLGQESQQEKFGRKSYAIVRDKYDASITTESYESLYKLLVKNDLH